jgi:tetratricopeptide (TPR) repeat protein
VPLPRGLVPTGFSGRDAALAWLADEQQQLALLLTQASAHGLGSYAWRLAVAQSRGLALRGGHEEELRLARVALGTAKRLGDATGQGCCYLLIGRALARAGELPTARFQLRRALGLFRSADAVAQLAEVHQALGDCAYRQGRYREFAAHARSRLAAARRSGDQVARCHALDGLGWALLQCGDYREAHVHCRESLALARDLGLPRAERELLDVDRSLARAELLAADGELEQARAVWRDVGRLTRLGTPTRAEYAERRLAAFRLPATAPR